MGFIVFVIIAAVIIYNVVNNSKARQEQWRVAAERLGLGYFSGDFGSSGKIRGIKGGHKVEVSTYTKNNGNNNSQSYTKYRVDYHEPIPVDFKISRQTTLHNIGQVFGLKDIQVGDPAFDERAAIKGMYPEKVIEFLTPSRRNEIMNLISTFNHTVVTNEYIQVDKPGKDSDSAVIYNTVRRLLSLCNELTDRSLSLAEEAVNRKKPEPPPIPVFEPVEPALDQFSIPNPIVPEPPVVELDDEIIMEEDEALNDIVCPSGFELDQVTLSADDDTEDDTVLLMDEVDEVTVSEPVDVVPGERGDLKEIATDLFGGGAASSLTVGKRFNESYEDRMVEGQGILKRVSKFNYDPVFKDSIGVKATVEVCELAGAYSKVNVSAEVKFNSDQYEELKLRVGSDFPISGKLVALDAMLHQLYVDSAPEA